MTDTTTVTTDKGEPIEVPLLDAPTLVDYDIQSWVYKTLKGHESLINPAWEPYRRHRDTDIEIEHIPVNEIREAAEHILGARYECMITEDLIAQAMKRFDELLTGSGYSKFSYETSLNSYGGYTWDSEWNIKELISILNKNKVCRVEVQFNGGGDEGYITDVRYTTDDGSTFKDEEAVLHRFSWVYDKKYRRGDRLYGPVHFQKALEDWAYTVTTEADWWNGEGGYGTFEFYQSEEDPNKWEYDLDISVYYEKTVVGRQGSCLVTLEE